MDNQNLRQYPQNIQAQPCPSCGYCPTCGRRKDIQQPFYSTYGGTLSDNIQNAVGQQVQGGLNGRIS